MYVLGSMIHVPGPERRVPIPWWHRAALGFEHETQVFASITQPTRERPGELLVSVLDLDRWAEHKSLRYEREDAPGVVEDVLGDVPQWNIALGETVTVEGGRAHHVDLICETYRNPSARGQPVSHNASDSPGFSQRSLRPFPVPFVWSRLGVIEHGWARFRTHGEGRTWRAELEQQLRDIGRLDHFDLDKLVLSGDTDSRLFRAIVPRKGAVLVSIEHADEPGVLRRLAGTLRQAEVNILSSLLKRGGAAPRNAILVAVCEPSNSATTGDLAARIRAGMSALPHSLRVDPRIDERGLSPESVIYSRHPEDIVAKVPAHLRARVQELRALAPLAAMPVFLSRRFLAGRAEHYAAKVREILTALGCHVVEAAPLSGGTRTSLDEVSAAMWASRAGIVLAVEAEHESDVSFSLNLAHEFGFMQGQGKPLLLLVEANSRVEKELDTWSNVKGITAPRFDRSLALADTSDKSIAFRVRQWISSVTHQKNRRDL